MGIANCNHRHAPRKYARWDCRDYEISDSVKTFCRDIGGKNAEEHRMSNPCWVETTSRFSSKRKFETLERLSDKRQLCGIHPWRAHIKHINRMQSERGGAKRRKGEPGSLGATGTLVA
jgi:hypothetical protein